MRHVKQCRDGRLVVIVLTPGTMKPHTAVAVSCVTVEATRAAHGTRPGSPGRHLSEIDCACRSVDCRPRRSGAAVRRTRAAGCGIRQVCLNSYFPNLQIQFRYNSYYITYKYNSGVRDKIQCSMHWLHAHS